MAPASFQLVHESGKPIEKCPLTFENLCMGRWQVEPFGAIDLGKTLHPSPFGGHSISKVLLLMVRTSTSPYSERDHQLAATLANFAERIKQSRESHASLLHEFSARSNFGVLSFIQSPLGTDQSPSSFLRQ